MLSWIVAIPLRCVRYQAIAFSGFMRPAMPTIYVCAKSSIAINRITRDKAEQRTSKGQANIISPKFLPVDENLRVLREACEQ